MRMSEPLPRAKRRPAPPRRRPKPMLSPRMLRLGAIGFAAALLIGGAGYAVASGWAGERLDAVGRGLVAVAADSGLRVRNVLVEGRAETKAADILEALQAERGAPLLAIDVAAAKERLERLPWVKSATVERRLPDTLRVRVEERNAFALWQQGKRLAVIDRDGTVIVRDKLARFADRPLVVGEGAERRAAEIVDLLAGDPKLRREVEAAVLVSGRRWNLRLKGGIEVRLPEEGMDQAWAQLARMVREEGLLGRAVTMVDLRQPDKAIVRLTPEAAKEPEEPGEST
ncbi:MAG: cell division protein [Rhodospirillales bacterium]|nr:cell division protein [Rhodospirillales bacterium]